MRSACMKKRLGAKYADVGRKVCGWWVPVYGTVGRKVCGCWVPVYGAVGCIYADVGCISAPWPPSPPQANPSSPIGHPTFENMKKTRIGIPRNERRLTAPHLCYGTVLEQKQ